MLAGEWIVGGKGNRGDGEKEVSSRCTLKGALLGLTEMGGRREESIRPGP